MRAWKSMLCTLSQVSYHCLLHHFLGSLIHGRDTGVLCVQLQPPPHVPLVEKHWYRPKDLRIINMAQRAINEAASTTSYSKTGKMVKCKPHLLCEVSQLYFRTKADCFVAKFHTVGLPTALCQMMHFQMFCELKYLFLTFQIKHKSVAVRTTTAGNTHTAISRKVKELLIQHSSNKSHLQRDFF